MGPCYSPLLKTAEQLFEHMAGALVKKRNWMSKGSIDLPDLTTSTTHGGSNAIRVDWTPVVAKGRMTICVDDRVSAGGQALPQELNHIMGTPVFAEGCDCKTHTV